MALTLYYLFASFSNPLPWSVCDPEWCTVDTNSTNTTTPNTILDQGVKILYDDDQPPVLSTSEQYWE